MIVPLQSMNVEVLPLEPLPPIKNKPTQLQYKNLTLFDWGSLIYVQWGSFHGPQMPLLQLNICLLSYCTYIVKIFEELYSIILIIISVTNVSLDISWCEIFQSKQSSIDAIKLTFHFLQPIGQFPSHRVLDKNSKNFLMIHCYLNFVHAYFYMGTKFSSPMIINICYLLYLTQIKLHLIP